MAATRNRWIGAAALALTVPAGWALMRFAKPLLPSRDLTAFHGVRLGMSLTDARARFDIPGTWQARPEGDLFVLDFTPRGESSVVHARFELHQGIVVAVRAETSPTDAFAAGAPLESSDAAVVARRPAADGTVHLTLIARSCPVHAPEVRELLESR